MSRGRWYREPVGPPAMLSQHDSAAYDLFAHCPVCQHHAGLDVPAILAKFGDRPVPEIRPMLRCLKCGYDGKDETRGTCAVTTSARNTGGAAVSRRREVETQNGPVLEGDGAAMKRTSIESTAEC